MTFAFGVVGIAMHAPDFLCLTKKKIFDKKRL
jgi:hypothetical protein